MNFCSGGFWLLCYFRHECIHVYEGATLIETHSLHATSKPKGDLTKGKCWSMVK
jgi:hypothetical protein